MRTSRKDGRIRLSMNEAMWLYRKMFPHDVSSFTSDERRQIAMHIEGYLNEGDVTPFRDMYNFTRYDGYKRAVERLERAYKSMTGWSLRSAKGPMLSMGEQEDGIVYVSALRAFRLRKGWTIKQLAERIGISASYLSSIELGKASLTVDVRNAAAKVLNVGVLELSGYVRMELSAKVLNNAPRVRGGSLKVVA